MLIGIQPRSPARPSVSDFSVTPATAIGGLLILFGLGARWVALLFVIEYAVTSFVVKAPRPAPGGGFNSMRIDLMLWVSAITIALVGPGALALESLVLRRARGQQPLTGRAVTT